MEVKINREIRNYTEAMFFGLSMRQFIFSACACVVAAGLYFLLKPYAHRYAGRSRLYPEPYYAEPSQG